MYPGYFGELPVVPALADPNQDKCANPSINRGSRTIQQTSNNSPPEQRKLSRPEIFVFVPSMYMY